MLVHLYEVIIHSSSDPEYLEHLQQLFQQLWHHHLEINLPKSDIGCSQLSVLGFHFTPKGISPSKDHLKALRQTPPPTSMQEIQQFLGLCNFFWAHIKNNAQTATTLNILTCKDYTWKGGPLPEEVLQSFQELQTWLYPALVVRHPCRDCPFCLITDASIGDETKLGGMGAILSQIDPSGEHYILGYTSCRISNFTPFLSKCKMPSGEWYTSPTTYGATHSPCPLTHREAWALPREDPHLCPGSHADVPIPDRIQKWVGDTNRLPLPEHHQCHSMAK
jgi:hypothetical protein